MKARRVPSGEKLGLVHRRILAITVTAASRAPAVATALVERDVGVSMEGSGSSLGRAHW